MGKILLKYQKQNVAVKMSRQRSKYSGWEYPVWVEIKDKKDPEYGWEQDANIYQDKKDAEKRFKEIVHDVT